MVNRFSLILSALLVVATAQAGFLDELKKGIETLDESLKSDQSASAATEPADSQAIPVEPTDSQVVPGSATQSVPRNETVTSQESQGLGDTDIYGVRLGMSPNTVIEVLKSKHPGATLNKGTGNRWEKRDAGDSIFFVEKPCFEASKEICIVQVTGSFTPNKDERRIINVSFYNELPLIKSAMFASNIRFIHYAHVFDFDRRQALEEKYGPSKNWMEREKSGEAESSPEFRDGPTYIYYQFDQGQAPENQQFHRSYSITHAWSSDFTGKYRAKISEQNDAIRNGNKKKASAAF